MSILNCRKTDDKTNPPNFKVYTERLTHTYICDQCKLGYKFDPNDRRKFQCPIHTSLFEKCGYTGGCCHHYEQVIKVACEKCGTEHDPATTEYHKITCEANTCSGCDKKAYTTNRSTHAIIAVPTGTKIKRYGDEYKCVQCFKEDALIEVLSKLLKKLGG